MLNTNGGQTRSYLIGMGAKHALNESPSPAHVQLARTTTWPGSGPDPRARLNKAWSQAWLAIAGYPALAQTQLVRIENMKKVATLLTVSLQLTALTNPWVYDPWVST